MPSSETRQAGPSSITSSPGNILEAASSPDTPLAREPAALVASNFEQESEAYSADQEHAILRRWLQGKSSGSGSSLATSHIIEQKDISGGIQQSESSRPFRNFASHLQMEMEQDELVLEMNILKRQERVDKAHGNCETKYARLEKEYFDAQSDYSNAKVKISELQDDKRELENEAAQLQQSVEELLTELGGVREQLQIAEEPSRLSRNACKTPSEPSRSLRKRAGDLLRNLRKITSGEAFGS